MNAEIIYIGSDFLFGNNASSCAQYLANKLAAKGIIVSYNTAVKNSTVHIENAIKTASERSNVIVTMGGFNDNSAIFALEIITNAFDIPLVIHEQVLDSIKSYFDSVNKPADSLVNRLAMLPEKCVIFPNESSFIPGCAFAKNNNLFVLLPEDKSELTAMFEHHVDSFLDRVADGYTVSHSFNTFGINESKIHSLFNRFPKSSNISIYVSSTGIENNIRITSHANNKQTAEANLNPYIKYIRQLLGSTIYGENTGSLQQTVIDRLRRKGLTIATAESCTAGLISKHLTEIPGSSDVFLCGVTAYSNDIKRSVLCIKEKTIEKYGAVSSETAAAMALGVKQISGAALGVSVTGIAGPDGGSENKPVGLVYIALTDGGRVWIKKIQAAKGRDRDYVRELASTAVLDLVRKYLDCLPEVMPGSISLNTYKTNSEFVNAVTPITNKKKRNNQLEVIAVVDDEPIGNNSFKKQRRKLR